MENIQGEIVSCLVCRRYFSRGGKNLSSDFDVVPLVKVDVGRIAADYVFSWNYMNSCLPYTYM